MTQFDLIQEIKTAFKGVTLEEGIGLCEGNGIDDYASKEQLLELRKQDEKENWENVPFDDICGTYESAFVYLDAKGMRFYLPQYLIADILWEELQDKGINMSFEPNWLLERVEDGQFELLNYAQIQAIIHYLEYNIQLEIEENKKYGVVDEYNQTLYTNSPVLQKWKQLLSDKREKK
ncbi:DUF6714 family protein [Phocoenobacter skyensis]|uniref:Uncharacterized protein n=1 Tax=Phocoenobacter skyensis TaxID=97481 RepID=A0AAJ6NEL3_9PAST|nr:DUF6714 family protein [Pasteurella skyensis]MDP8175393.1 hypothetical protein [Pasteurella skyensis]